jgi:hypothetical protein
MSAVEIRARGGSPERKEMFKESQNPKQHASIDNSPEIYRLHNNELESFLSLSLSLM